MKRDSVDTVVIPEHTGDTLTQKVNEIIEYLKPEIDVGKDVNSTDKLAEDLAMYFQDAGETVSNGPCSCMGVSCSSLGCVALWQSVLANPKILDEAMALYRNYKC